MIDVFALGTIWHSSQLLILLIHSLILMWSDSMAESDSLKHHLRGVVNVAKN
jgi:hypothetical protein